MKKLYTIILAVLVTTNVFTQVPDKMSYHAVVRDGNDALVASSAIGMQISILKTTATGTAVYVETQTPTSNTNGLVSLEIGTGTIVSGDFTTIDWANGPYFIKIETDPTGGTSYTITGTTQLLSVPYALYAKNSGSSIAGPQGPIGLTGDTGATGGYPVHTIGEAYGGGIVFYVYDGGQHGLIAATADQSTGIKWFNGDDGREVDPGYKITGASGDGLGAGAMNTALIIAAQMADNESGIYAAKVCADYSVTVNGIMYGDWYLPSAYELNLLIVQYTVVGISRADTYWSSTENDRNTAMSLGFGFYYPERDTKREAYFHARAIRSF